MICTKIDKISKDSTQTCISDAERTLFMIYSFNSTSVKLFGIVFASLCNKEGKIEIFIMFALPPRVKETSVLRSHYYIVDVVKRYDSFVQLKSGKFLMKGFRGRSDNPIYLTQMYKFLKCELFLYLGFKINNFKEWIDQILPMYSEIDMTKPIIIANTSYENMVNDQYMIPLHVTIEPQYEYVEFEEISFIKYLDSLFETNIHILLNNELFALKKIYNSSKFFNSLKTLPETLSNTIIKLNPYIVINMYKTKKIENTDIAPLLPSLEDWISYEYVRSIFNLPPSKYGSRINRIKYGMVDIFKRPV